MIIENCTLLCEQWIGRGVICGQFEVLCGRQRHDLFSFDLCSTEAKLGDISSSQIPILKELRKSVLTAWELVWDACVGNKMSIRQSG